MIEQNNDWYLAEWLAFRDKRQADIVRDLSWNKARVSLMIAGKQQYTRNTINDLAAYLKIAPYELLIHPNEAIAFRNLRAAAANIGTSLEVSGV